MPNEDVTHFTAVDQTRDPAFFARFLDEGNKLPAIVASKPIIIDGLRLQGAERVLDVGCGTGLLAQRLSAAGHDVVGLALSLGMLLQGTARLRYVQGDAVALPFPDTSFDGAVTVAALHHIFDQRKAAVEKLKTPDEIAARQKALREKFVAALGGFP